MRDFYGWIGEAEWIGGQKHSGPEMVWQMLQPYNNEQHFVIINPGIQVPKGEDENDWRMRRDMPISNRHSYGGGDEPDLLWGIPVPYFIRSGHQRQTELACIVVRLKRRPQNLWCMNAPKGDVGEQRNPFRWVTELWRDLKAEAIKAGINQDTIDYWEDKIKANYRSHDPRHRNVGPEHDAKTNERSRVDAQEQLLSMLLASIPSKIISKNFKSASTLYRILDIDMIASHCPIAESYRVWFRDRGMLEVVERFILPPEFEGFGAETTVRQRSPQSRAIDDLSIDLDEVIRQVNDYIRTEPSRPFRTLSSYFGTLVKILKALRRFTKISPQGISDIRKALSNMYWVLDPNDEREKVLSDQIIELARELGISSTN